MQHGQEKTPKEYISKEVEFAREVRKKLTPDGVYALIIGETYRGGYQGIGSKLEVELENDDWQIIDVNIWVKSNPSPSQHPSRFLPGYERIITMCRKGAKPNFTNVTRESKSKRIQVIKGTQLTDGSCGYSIASTQSSITNVITTPVFNTKELKDIDPNFKHDAPCPMKIYEIFIEAYSEVGDTILDGFCGSSGGLDYAINHGRNAIGFDIDPVSIEFARKRLERLQSEGVKNDLKSAA